MIICHDRQLVFLKCRKVGGTSFEIALSLFCGPHDVLTPLTADDERLRARIGGRGPQNFDRLRWPGTLRRRRLGFRNHSPAAQVRALMPARLWSRYTKIAIARDPFEVAVSRYYWRRARGRAADTDFGTFVARHRARLSANARIAPFSGADRIDRFLRYDHLPEDMAALGLGDVADIMQGLTAKSGPRPPGATASALYTRYPEAARIIADTCADEIAHFGYHAPV
jgi:hypothetical protein